MPKVRTSRTRYPDGWETVEPTLMEFEGKMREAETEPHEGKRKTEALWPILRINHQRSRYVYEMYYKKHEISREVYEFCLKHKYADAALIAKWKKPGYERLCCVKCISTKDTNFGTVCICRVPISDRDQKAVECPNCGCRSCVSGET